MSYVKGIDLLSSTPFSILMRLDDNFCIKRMENCVQNSSVVKFS